MMPAASLHQRANGVPHDNGVMDVPLLGDPQLHDALLGDPAKLTEPIKRVEDKFQLLPAFLKVAGPMTAAMLWRNPPRVGYISSTSAACAAGAWAGPTAHRVIQLLHQSRNQEHCARQEQ